MSLLDRYSDFVQERGKKTKVALVGAGQMGQGIVTQINKMPDTDLVLIVDKNENKLDMAQSNTTRIMILQFQLILIHSMIRI